ncbi:hypothetical protein EDD18DRAFT_1097413 [Armillaria luteobubalina]|uniref:Uncharacterized protein n=1 Tax=Armillaria luteobubalina TaxID=153913 RepID=A0AA39QN30_9AGAR|nr:hypothetical protein EDD18DRAFT_1097413 [Armillaria luteobubalina]
MNMASALSGVTVKIYVNDICTISDGPMRHGISRTVLFTLIGAVAIGQGSVISAGASALTRSPASHIRRARLAQSDRASDFYGGVTDLKYHLKAASSTLAYWGLRSLR